MHPFISQLACAKKSDTNKKPKPDNTLAAVAVAIAVAITTILTGGGYVFELFNDNSPNRNGDHKNPGNTKTFITAKTRTPLVDLNGKWLFAKGDDMERAQPGFDDSSWRQIAVPAYWEDKGAKDYNGYAWYRRTFQIEEETDQPIKYPPGKPSYSNSAPSLDDESRKV